MCVCIDGCAVIRALYPDIHMHTCIYTYILDEHMPRRLYWCKEDTGITTNEVYITSTTCSANINICSPYNADGKGCINYGVCSFYVEPSRLSKWNLLSVCTLNIACSTAVFSAGDVLSAGASCIFSSLSAGMVVLEHIYCWWIVCVILRIWSHEIEPLWVGVYHTCTCMHLI